MNSSKTNFHRCQLSFSGPSGRLCCTILEHHAIHTQESFTTIEDVILAL